MALNDTQTHLLVNCKRQVQCLQAQREASEATERAAAAEAAVQQGGKPSPPSTPIAASGGNRPKVPLLKLQGEVPVSLLDTDDSWGNPPSAEVLSRLVFRGSDRHVMGFNNTMVAGLT